VARYVHHHQERSPARRVRGDRVDGDGYFFPGEVARMLLLDGIDYRQLREMFKLVRKQRLAPVTRAWARFSLVDLACLEALLGVCGDREALAPGRKLSLRGIEACCDALRAQGFENPLLEVTLKRQGARVLAVIDGAVVDPRTGQQALSTTEVVVQRFLDERLIKDRQLRAELTRERRRRQTTARLNSLNVSIDPVPRN